MGRPYGLVITKDKNITISSYVDYGHPWRTCTGVSVPLYFNYNPNYSKFKSMNFDDMSRRKTLFIFRIILFILIGGKITIFKQAKKLLEIH